MYCVTDSNVAINVYLVNSVTDSNVAVNATLPPPKVSYQGRAEFRFFLLRLESIGCIINFFLTFTSGTFGQPVVGSTLLEI